MPRYHAEECPCEQPECGTWVVLDSREMNIVFRGEERLSRRTAEFLNVCESGDDWDVLNLCAGMMREGSGSMLVRAEFGTPSGSVLHVYDRRQ